MILNKCIIPGNLNIPFSVIQTQNCAAPFGFSSLFAPSHPAAPPSLGDFTPDAWVPLPQVQTSSHLLPLLLQPPGLKLSPHISLQSYSSLAGNINESIKHRSDWATLSKLSVT